MAALSWPATLPQSILKGPGEVDPNIFVVTETDKGPKKTRRKQTGRWTEYTCQIRVNESQKRDFKDFFFNDCKMSKYLFDWVRPTDSSDAVEMRFLPGVMPTYQNTIENIIVIQFSVEVRETA